jgi:hypothetical protein
MSLASLLTVLISPWFTLITTVLLALTSGVLIYGEPDGGWVSWIPRVVSILALVGLSVNFLHALGWLP